MQLNINQNEDQVLVCYGDPSNRKQCLVDYFGQKSVREITFISSSLMLAKLQYNYIDRFGKLELTSDTKRVPMKPKNYWSVFDINGFIKPVPQEIEGIEKVYSYPQLNGNQILVSKKGSEIQFIEFNQRGEVIFNAILVDEKVKKNIYQVMSAFKKRTQPTSTLQ